MNKAKSWKTGRLGRLFYKLLQKKYFGFIKNIFQNELFLSKTLPSRPTDNLIHFLLGCIKLESSTCSKL